MGRSRKPLWVCAHRGFKSHLFRQKARRQAGFFFRSCQPTRSVAVWLIPSVAPLRGVIVIFHAPGVSPVARHVTFVAPSAQRTVLRTLPLVATAE